MSTPRRRGAWDRGETTSKSDVARGMAVPRVCAVFRDARSVPARSTERSFAKRSSGGRLRHAAAANACSPKQLLDRCLLPH